MRFPLIRFACLLVLAAASLTAKNLDIYVIDVEGGKSVLLVSPSGQSMLFDTGWPASNNRRASTERIVEVAKAAGLKRIDLLVISHYDIDHMGDVPALVAKIPVGRIFDHGGSQTNPRFEAYAAVRDKIGHTVLKPGDKVPIKGVDIQVLAAGGKLIRQKGTPNPLCEGHTQAAELPTDVEDNNSIGLLITFGKFRMLDLADLEAHYSHDLVCPANMIGNVSVYNVNVHGQFKGIAPELVGALKAPVIIQANGSRKGADAQSWLVLKSAPGLKDIWQLHTSLNAGKDANPPDDFIANLESSDGFKWVKISAAKSGKFTVTNTRTGFSKAY
ncbi:MAG: MBL fold metallo-hydrolase [Acidobacteriota bacterium]|nr:MBL fold metallo-hydrolase [Acidobacteriota bacterium]